MEIIIWILFGLYTLLCLVTSYSFCYLKYQGRVRQSILPALCITIPMAICIPIVTGMWLAIKMYNTINQE